MYIRPGNMNCIFKKNNVESFGVLFYYLYYNNARKIKFLKSYNLSGDNSNAHWKKNLSLEVI